LQDLAWTAVDCVWHVMAHAQKPDFVFRRNGRVHLNRQGRQFSRLPAGELCTSACRVLYCSCKPVFCSHVTLTGDPLHSLVSPSLLLPCVTVCHHTSNAVYIPGNTASRQTDGHRFHKLNVNREMCDHFDTNAWASSKFQYNWSLLFVSRKWVRHVNGQNRIMHSITVSNFYTFCLKYTSINWCSTSISVCTWTVLVNVSFVCLQITLLTYSMEQSRSWESNWLAASQEIPRISRNPKVHYRTHKRSPPVSILG
jgi:hypothetical protein